MQADALAAIAAFASAAVALGAAWTAKKSADRSAAAEENSARAAERSAKAAEEAVSIERQRFGHEEDARAVATAPRIEVLGKWRLERSGAFVGMLSNAGPSGAIIERVTLNGPDTPVEFVASDPNWKGSLDVGERVTVQAAWPWGDAVDGTETVTVVYASAETTFRAEARFEMLRRNSTMMGEPEWSADSRRDVRRLPSHR